MIETITYAPGEGPMLIRPLSESGQLIELAHRAIHAPGELKRTSVHPLLPTQARKTANVELHRAPLGKLHAVRLTATVLEAIEREIRSFGAPKGVECGGLLWALTRPRRYETVAVHSSGPGSGSRHGPSSMTLGYAEDVQREELPDFLQHLELAGSWHTHPGRSNIPSDADLRAWRSELERSGHLHYIGLIVNRDPRGEMGWTKPAITGWHLSRNMIGEFECELAFVDHP